MRADREAALQAFFQARAYVSQPATCDDSLSIDLYRGLMRSEMDRSCFGAKALPEKMKHVQEAGQYCDEVAEAALRSQNTGIQAHVKLQGHMIRGR